MYNVVWNGNRCDPTLPRLRKYVLFVTNGKKFIKIYLWWVWFSKINLTGNSLIIFYFTQNGWQ